MGSDRRSGRGVASLVDVVVVGGGTAGLFASYLLARQGIRVCLFDGAERLGPPARTLIITSRLSHVLGFVPTQAIVNRTPTLRIASPLNSVSIRLREPDLIVERQALVETLAEKAASAGLEIHTGCRFTGVASEPGGLTVHLESRQGRIQRVRTRNLVGADGVRSQVARVVGLGGFGLVSLLQARIALPAWARPDTTQVWFDPQSTPFFYWLEPESANSAVVGLIADGASGAQEGLRAFLARHGLAPMGYQAAEIPFHRTGAPLACRLEGGRVFLVGDAAAQVKMTTVGGVVTGLRGAEALARAIACGTSYARELAGLRCELALHLLVHGAARRLSPSDYDSLVGLVDGRVERIMASHTRDEIARILLPSLLAQPRFVLLGLTHLLQRHNPRPTAHTAQSGT